MKIYTGGTFDCPHIGHAIFFRKIRKIFPNDYLVVALNTDEFIEEFKGSKPLYTFDERKELLGLLDEIDAIVPNTDGADSRPTILRTNADVIVIGNDWLEKDYCKQMGFTPQWLRDYNITLCYLPYTDGISTSDIKRRINAR